MIAQVKQFKTPEVPDFYQITAIVDEDLLETILMELDINLINYAYTKVVTSKSRGMEN